MDWRRVWRVSTQADSALGIGGRLIWVGAWGAGTGLAVWAFLSENLAWLLPLGAGILWTSVVAFRVRSKPGVIVQSGLKVHSPTITQDPPLYHSAKPRGIEVRHIPPEVIPIDPANKDVVKEGSSHRLLLRITNTGRWRAYFAAQITRVEGFLEAPAPPWDVRWREHPKRLCKLDRNEARLLEIAEADYMDWSRRDQLPISSGTLWFLTPQNRHRVVLENQSTTPYEYETKPTYKGTTYLEIRKGRRQPVPIRLSFWFEPDPDSSSAMLPHHSLQIGPFEQ